MDVKKTLLDKTVASISIVFGFVILADDVRDFVIINFLSDNVFYLGFKPLSVRLSQWIGYIFLIISGVLFLKNKKLCWISYQLTGALLLFERLIVFFVLFQLFYGSLWTNFVLPVVGATTILIYTNRREFLSNFGVTTEKWIRSEIISLAISIITILLPKAKFIMDLL